MTENKPQWLIDRELQRTAAEPLPSDDGVITFVQEQRAICLDNIQAETDGYQPRRAAADKVEADGPVLTRINARVMVYRDEITRFMADGDVDKAVEARKSLDAATAIRDELQAQVDAQKALFAGYDFEAHELRLATLVSERNILDGLLASRDKRAEIIMDIADKRQAAREQLAERSIRHTALMLEATDPKRLAEAAEAETRRKTQEAHEDREAAALARAPRAPRTNADPRVAALAEQALAGISHGARVDPMPALNLSTGGPAVPARMPR